MKIRSFSFEKLDVWTMAKDLVKLIYQKTRLFPEAERYGLTSQMRRASVSVASNLAEGSARRTAKDKMHFTNLAYSSLMELLNQGIISFELEFLIEEDYFLFRKHVQDLSFKLNALRKSQEDDV